MPDHTQVLIVGGGPVGLALAADLGRRGVECMIVERSTAVSPLPKMNHLNARSMELCRRWGVRDAVRACGWPDDYPMDVAYVTSLAGHEIARLPFPSHGERAVDPAIPEPSQRCPQIWFEPLLEERIASLPTVSLARGCELVSLSQNEDTAAPVLRELGRKSDREITADFVVGADGAGSSVRRILEIERDSWGPAPQQMAIALRTKEFFRFHDKARAAFFIVLDEGGVRSFITPTDGEELWRFNWNLRPGESVEDFDPHAAVRTLAGTDFDYEILGSFAWQVRFTLAQTLRRGRVFLAGDAAHTLSPTGGLGLNTGLADVADLGWKLAAHLEGWGGNTLLESYDLERRAAAKAIMEESFRNLLRLRQVPQIADPDDEAERAEAKRTLEDGDFRLEWENEGAALGGRYADSPVIADEANPPAYDPNHFVPSSFPGCRAPHALLDDGRSTLDLFDDAFVLLAFGAAPSAIHEFEHAAEKATVPLRTLAIEDDETATLYQRKLVLVRPDGIVAWRGNDAPADTHGLIARVTGNIP